MTKKICYPDHSPPIHSDWLLEVAKDYGFSSEDLRAVIVPEGASEPNWNMLPVCSYITLINWLAESVNDPNFGINQVPKMNLESFGANGAMIAHTATLRESCESLARYDKASSLASSVEFFPLAKENVSVMSYRVLVPAHIDPRHEEVSAAALFVSFIRLHLGQDWHPVKAQFSFSKPKDIEVYEQFFGHNIQFNAPVTALWFSNIDLETKINNANPFLLKALNEHIESLYQKAIQQEDIVAKVRHLISRSLGSKSCTAEAVARTVFMSRRHLTRQLAKRSTSFRDLKNEVVIEVAKKILCETNTNISEIANRLGFSETSSFNRAFKSMTGASPSAYRKQF